MLSNMKKWQWHDWMISIVRTLWLINFLLVLLIDPKLYTAPIWIVLMLAFAVYTIPVFIQQFSNRGYIASEIILAGAFHIFLIYALPEQTWQFVIFAFMIGFFCNRQMLWWATIPTIVIIPPILGWISGEPLHMIALTMPFRCATGFIFGYAFQTLVQNQKHRAIIEEQKRVLEQHISQIGELTLMEERSRLSHELHDTIGHTLTSLVVGMESLRPSLPDQQSERLHTLIELGRNGLDDIRKHLHQLSPAPFKGSLSESLIQLTQDFTNSTGVAISFRLIGNEVPVMNQMSFCLYRCTQESLTNAVRHGGANSIIVHLYFENEQLRLQIEDNGAGMEQVRYGFGLTGMKERLHQWRGYLTIHSRPNEGTIVICTLPFQIEEEPEARIKLLLVDDQAIITDSLGQIFAQHADLNVVGTAGDGQIAVEQCETYEPDIVLMDVQMKGMNGIEALQVMKERWPNMKVVLMTTFEDPTQAATALGWGADGYMLKSIHPRELTNAIKLIYSGGTWIDQTISTLVFEDIKRQKENHKEHQKQGHLQEELPYGLTKRELEILQLLAAGMRYKSIATKLFLSEGTIRNYCSTLYSKLGVSNREEAIEAARSEALLVKEQ
nr:hybrid sensor histidine kinase/response regulator transcription factor [Paenibacillus sp. L3-i20]